MFPLWYLDGDKALRTGDVNRRLLIIQVSAPPREVEGIQSQDERFGRGDSKPIV